MTETPLPPSLRPTASDRAVTGLRAITSAVDVIAPGVGSLFGELAGIVIPNQREERMILYVASLGRQLRDQGFVSGAHAERLDELEKGYRELARKLSPEQVALFEDGAYQSARATSAERIERIARIVSQGITEDEARAIAQRRFLDLLGELSEEDLIHLAAFSHKYMFDEEWHMANRAAFDVSSAAIGTTIEEAERHVETKYRRYRLLRLGVLEQQKTSGNQTRDALSAVGLLVLQRTGVLGPDEV